MSVEFNTAQPPTYPRVSDHVDEDRWTHDINPVTAWYAGVDVTDFLRRRLPPGVGWKLRSPETRVVYHAGTDELLVCECEVLVTSINIEERAEVVLREVIRRRFGSPQEDRS
jgi:hypothetical protein